MDRTTYQNLLASARRKFLAGEMLNGDEKISALIQASQSLYEEWTGDVLWHITDPELKISGKPSQPPRNPQNILVIQLYSVGDLVGLTPVLRGLREQYPDATISVLTERGPGRIILRDPHVDNIFYFERGMITEEMQRERPDFVLLFQHVLLLCEQLDAMNFDLAINMHYTIRHAIWAGICGASFIKGLYTDNALQPLASGDLWDFYPLEVSFHPKGRKFHVVEGLELNLRRAWATPSDRNTSVEADDEAEKFADRFFKEAGVAPNVRPVAINPDAGTDLKTWPADRYAALIRRLVKERGETVLLLGKPGAPELTAGISEMAGVSVLDDRGEPNLDGVAALLSRCKALVTGDTGIMHLAGAVGTPCLVLDGPTPQAPAGGVGHLAIQANIECMNCGPFHNCKIDKECLRRIEPDDAFELLALVGRTDLSAEDLPEKFRTSEQFFVYWMDGAKKGPLVGYRWLNADGDFHEAAADRFVALLLLSLRAEQNRQFNPQEPSIDIADMYASLERSFGPLDRDRMASALNARKKEIESNLRQQVSQMFGQSSAEPDLEMYRRLLDMFEEAGHLARQ